MHSQHAQLAGKDGIQQHQKRSASNLDDRVFTSLLAVILGVILIEVLRVRRIQRIRQERERQV
jgi:hypothetical protein